MQRCFTLRLRTYGRKRSCMPSPIPARAAIFASITTQAGCVQALFRRVVARRPGDPEIVAVEPLQGAARGGTDPSRAPGVGCATTFALRRVTRAFPRPAPAIMNAYAGAKRARRRLRAVEPIDLEGGPPRLCVARRGRPPFGTLRARWRNPGSVFEHRLGRRPSRRPPRPPAATNPRHPARCGRRRPAWPPSPRRCRRASPAAPRGRKGSRSVRSPRPRAGDLNLDILAGSKPARAGSSVRPSSRMRTGWPILRT